MNKKYSLFLFLAALIGLSSCNSLRIEKRHYTGGWYVDYSTDKKTEPVAAVSEEQNETTVVTVAPEETVPGTYTISEDGQTTQMAVGSGSTYQWTATETNEPATGATDPSDETDGTPSVVQDNTETANHSGKSSPQEVSAGDDQVLLIILAILVPPLAVYMVQGLTAIFWITLICWLFGGFFLFGRFGYGYLGGLGLLAIILALLVVFGKL